MAQAVAEGMAGRDLGWWKVDVTPDGAATWQRVDAPGDGPRMTVEQTPAQPVQPQWHPVQRWAPADLTEPSPARGCGEAGPVRAPYTQFAPLPLAERLRS